MLELRRHRRTKIVATIGPASRSAQRISELIKAGANVFRLNFSHGKPSDHLESLHTIRTVSKELNIPVGILQDLSGPKIRISNVEGDYAQIKDNEVVHLAPARGDPSNAFCIFVEGLNPLEVLKPGQQALLADGLIELKAEEIGREFVKTRIVKGGRIRSRVGIAFPDSAVDLPATTDKDLEDLKWGIDHDVDFVAISFVKSAADINKLREIIKQHKGHAQLIAKIERKAALAEIDGIMEVADGIMVARGDLGLELPMEQVPMVQKRLIEQSNYRGIPVIVATQMLHSMITSVRPTRAEVADIALAVMSGADAVMLSEETTIGEHPVLCVEYLSKIAVEAESNFEFNEYKLRLRDADRATIPDAVAYAACAAAVKVKASAVVACTETGTSARLVAKYRPQQPLYGASPLERTLRRMCLYWGVNPLADQPASNQQDEIQAALSAVQLREKLPRGSRVVITGGLKVRIPGATSALQIREIE